MPADSGNLANSAYIIQPRKLLLLQMIREHIQGSGKYRIEKALGCIIYQYCHRLVFASFRIQEDFDVAPLILL